MNDFWKMSVLIFSIIYITRGLPLFFSKWILRQVWLERIGKFLPLLIMVLLVFHTISRTKFIDAPYGAPTLLSIAGTLLVHHLWRIMLISMGAGMIIFHILSSYLS